MLSKIGGSTVLLVLLVTTGVTIASAAMGTWLKYPAQNEEDREEYWATDGYISEGLFEGCWHDAVEGEGCPARAAATAFTALAIILGLVSSALVIASVSAELKPSTTLLSCTILFYVLLQIGTPIVVAVQRNSNQTMGGEPIRGTMYFDTFFFVSIPMAVLDVLCAAWVVVEDVAGKAKRNPTTPGVDGVEMEEGAARSDSKGQPPRYSQVE